MARRFEKLDDSRLAARVHSGDAAAFEVLYDRHHRALLSFCRHMLGNAEDGEDALQQTFLRAHKALVAGQLPDAVRPWLFAIARNRCKTMLAARREACVPVDDVEPSFDGLTRDVADARRPARAGGRPRPPAGGAARGARPLRARRDVPGRDRGRDRRPRRQGQGARLPGAHRADGRARRPHDAVRDDPRGARGRARRRAAARAAAAAPAQLRVVRGLPHGRRRAARGPGLDPARQPRARAQGDRARRRRGRRWRGRGRRGDDCRWPTSWR